jgi:hypothetical protein
MSKSSRKRREYLFVFFMKLSNLGDENLERFPNFPTIPFEGIQRVSSVLDLSRR